MKGRPSCFLFEIVLLFTFLLLPFYFLPFPLRYFAPQSHLHIGLPFGTPIPCLQLEQVMIRLGTFSPTLLVVSFTISVHEGTTKLLSPDFCRLFYFSPFFFCRSIFFLFQYVTLHPHRISISDYYSELHFMSAGVAGKSFWWIPFLDSCIDVICFSGPCGGDKVVTFQFFMITTPFISFVMLLLFLPFPCNRFKLCKRA